MTMTIAQKTIEKMHEQAHQVARDLGEMMAHEHIEDHHDQDSLQIYMTLIVKENNIEDFTIHDPTQVFYNENSSFLLLHTEPIKQYAIQSNLILFADDESYQDQFKDLIATTLAKKVEHSMHQELDTLMGSDLFTVVETNQDLIKSLAQVEDKRMYDLYEQQFIHTHGHQELSYQKHEVMQAIENEDNLDDLASKYDLNQQDISFLKVASAVEYDRMMDLIEDIVEERPISAPMTKNTLETMQEDVEIKPYEKEVLYLLNIISYIEDRDHTNLAEENNIKSALVDMIDTFSNNGVSLYFVIEKMEQADGTITGDIADVIDKGYSIENNKLHTQQQQIDFTETTPTVIPIRR